MDSRERVKRAIRFQKPERCTRRFGNTALTRDSRGG
mgnify:CR=1 FL=1